MKKVYILILLLVVIAVNLTIFQCKPVLPKLEGAGVHGSVFVSVKGTDNNTQSGKTRKVYLPDLRVFLKNTSTGDESTPIVTDLYGRFMFPILKPGTYRLIWKSQMGWAAGQYPKDIVIGNNTQYPGPVEIFAEKNGRVLAGKVSLADGSTPYFHEQSFGITATATVSIFDSADNSLATPVRANVAGEYAVAGLPAYPLRAKATSERAVAVLPVSGGGSLSSVNLKFKNSRPQIQGFIGKRHAAPGETINVSLLMRDFNGDVLSFKWRNAGVTNSLTPSGSSAGWALPTEPGLYTIYMVVADSNGGYASGRFTVNVGATHEFFAGKVVDANGAPVAGAVVSFNDTAVSTNSKGAYTLRVRLSKLYVMNITKTGFALFSRRFYRGNIGQTWQLVQTQVSSVDPTRPIEIVDQRRGLEKDSLKGVRIKIPANSLVDSLGNLPTGNLNASLATLNIAKGEAPGDWGAIENGKEVNLISYGAAFVEFRDLSGKKFNLARGKLAEVTMFLSRSRVGSAAETAPLWSYDETDGLWKPSGKATFNRANGTYIGTVPHFSTINTDLSYIDVSCLKVILDPSIPTGWKLRITDVPGQGTEFAQAFEFTMDATVNAVYRLPPNTNVKLELFDQNNIKIGNLVVAEIPGTPLPNNIVNSGPPMPPGVSPFPDVNSPGINDCKAITLSLGIPEWGGYPGSPFLTYPGVGDEPTANAYYAAIDPASNRTTLGAWWTANGFDATGEAAGSVRTSYLNYNDLGSGRDMHFLQHADGRVSAYVTNYSNGGPFDQNPAFADMAAGKINPGATVCMEYSPVTDGDTDPTHYIVKFFVYAGNGFGAAAVRVPGADLDGFGDKFVPNLCNNCHGGSYFPSNPVLPTPAEINMHASFRELDLATYKYQGFSDVPTAAERALFKQQNLIVKASQPRQAIIDLIDGWYAGGGDIQDINYAPVGWTGAPQQQLYTDVVAVSCRTCHIAFLSEDDTYGINWNSYAQFLNKQSQGGAIGDAVCGSYKFMPHALITYRNFWLSTSPSRPATLQNFSKPGWPAIGNCPQ